MSAEPDVQITVSRATPKWGLSREIAERVRVEIAKRPDVKQVHIARAIGMPQQNFSNRCSGHVPFEASVIAQVAAYLGVQVSALIPELPAKVVDAPSARSSTDRASDYGSEGSRNFTLIPGGLRSVPVATDTHRHLSLVTHSG